MQTESQTKSVSFSTEQLEAVEFALESRCEFVQGRLDAFENDDGPDRSHIDSMYAFWQERMRAAEQALKIVAGA